MQTKKCEIFISYKNNNDSEGRTFADKLSSSLKKIGYIVYYDPDEQCAGNFPERLRKAIEECNAFLLILTQVCLNQLMSQEENWVKEEVLTAKKANKKIIPLFMPDFSMPKYNDMSEDIRFLHTTTGINIYEPLRFDESPLQRIMNFMNFQPANKDSFSDVFQSNSQYDVNKDFSDTLEKAKAGDDKAMYEIANMYFYGFTNEKGESKRDFEMAYIWFEKTSRRDSPYADLALSMLGKMHYRGVVPGEKQSFEKAFNCHKRASETSQYSKQQYAYMLSVGLGCEFDYNLAEMQYLSAIEHGDNVAINDLAEFYMKYGEFKKAESLYKSIVNTYPKAAYELGCMYMNGLLSDNRKPNFYAAASYFERAIAKNDCIADSHYQLGVLYFRATDGFSRDYVLAEKNFKIAADNGHTHAAYMLAYMYEHGHVELNLEKAIHYHILASDRGNTLSPTHLAVLYQLPEFCDYHQALKYAQLAAGYGEKEGEFIYGNLLFFGRGCEPNINEAYKVYKSALAHGCDQASFMIDRIDSIRSGK